MSKTNGILATLAEILLKAVGSGRASRTTDPRRPDARLRTPQETSAPAGTETARIDPDRIRDLRVAYAPQRDGARMRRDRLDLGALRGERRARQRPSRARDRPAVSGSRVRGADDQQAARRGAGLPLDRDRGLDSQGRESWVDIEQLYSVHERGLRREAAVLDRGRYDRVGTALTRRYGWSVAG